jgi:hypothetical protein
MKIEKLTKCMDFMMNALENMETNWFGNISLMFLVIFH